MTILFVTPVIMLAILEFLLPDEGSIDAARLDRVFWVVAIFVVIAMNVVAFSIFLANRRYLFVPMKIVSNRAKAFAEGRPVLARERFAVREIDDLSDSVNGLFDAVMSREERLQQLNMKLEETVYRRTEELQETIEQLRSTREQLMLSEKMIVLGSLVTGVAHELNSPLSIGVTAASFLNERSKSLLSEYDNLALTQEDLELFLSDSEESSRIIQENLDQAARIIGSLQQVAADQQVDEHRPFELGSYVNDILLSLNHKMRAGKHQIKVVADAVVSVDTYPGAVTQVLNNLVFNSLIHGFENKEGGRILISITKKKNLAEIRYSDDGKGIDEDIIDRIFDQFYTSRRGRGGTGLGMSVVKDVVTNTLGGTIDIVPPEGGGAGFLISFPVDCTKKAGENE